MADEKVTIKIDVKADTSQIDRVKRKLAELCAQAEACEKQLNDYGKATRTADKDLKELNKTQSSSIKNQRQSVSSTNALSNAQKKLGYQVRDNRGLLDKMAGVLKTPFRLAVIGASLETAGLALALSSVNGLLIAGRALVKGYHMAMSGLAKAAAAAGVALATVAAAQRQYIAAQASGRYGGSFTASSQALRTLTGDARLASLGMKTLTGAFQAASKNAPVTKQTASALAGLMDFAYLSGDIEKGTAALANFISLVQKGGARGKGVTEAAAELGPEFEKAFKEVSRGGKATTQELMKSFAGGTLAQKAGIGGTAANVSGSLVGQLKASFVEAQLLFGDLGMVIIKDVQKAFEALRKIFTRTFRQLAPVIRDFAPTLLNGTVKATDKLSQFIVKLMREYVPRVEGFFTLLSTSWDKLTRGFEKFSKYLNEFSDASKIINKFFGQIFKQGIGAGLKKNFESFANTLRDNREEFDKFGKRLRDLILEIFRLFNTIRDAFFSALPAINGITGAITGLVSAVSSLIAALSQLGPYMSLFALLGTASIIPGRRGRGGFLRGRGGAGFLAKNRGALAAGAVSMTAGQAFGGDIGTGLGLAGLGAYGGYKLAGSARFRDAMLGAAVRGGRLGFPAFAPLAEASTSRMMGAGAAIAGGSYATNAAMNFVERRYDSDAAVIGTGAVGGAATGAAAGAILAGPTAGASIAVGAVIGALVGGISGWLKSGEAKRKSREAGKQFTEDYVGAVEDLLASNNIDEAANALQAFDERAKEFSETQTRSGEAFKESMKVFEESRKALEGTVAVASGRLDDLSRVTNMTKDQIIELANELQFSLGDSALSIVDILSMTGIAVRRFGEDFQNYVTDTFATDIEGIMTDVQILDAPKVKDELANALVEGLRSDTLGNAEFGEFLQGILDQNLMTMGAMGADQAMIAMLGETFGQGIAFMEGGFFGSRGISAQDFTPQQQQIYNQYVGRREESYAMGAAENIYSMLAERGKLPSGMTVETFASKLVAGGSINDIMALSQKLSEGQVFVDEFGVQAGGRHGGGGPPLEEQLSTLLEGFGVNVELTKTNDQMMREGITEFNRGVGTFKGSAYEVFKGAVDKFDTAVEKMPGDDTSTPRRNIVNTLGAHSRFDAMIAGKRSVMSGLRNWNLGSMSSDHASGHAYDLVGQNLGLYQTAIQASGGYAEFHGGSAGRHLHVVPNTNTAPIGDSASPYMGAPIATSSSGGVTNVNMTVNATPGMDVNALAAEVIYQIEKQTRSRQERY